MSAGRFQFSSLLAKCAFIIAVNNLITGIFSTLFGNVPGTAIAQIIANRWTDRFNAFYTAYQTMMLAPHDADKCHAVEIIIDDMWELAVNLVKTYDPISQYSEAQAGKIFGPILPISIYSRDPRTNTQSASFAPPTTFEALGVPGAFKIHFGGPPRNNTSFFFRTVQIKSVLTGEVLGVYHTGKHYLQINLPDHAGEEVEITTWYEDALGQPGQVSAPYRIRLLANLSPPPNSNKDESKKDTKDDE